MNKPSIPTSRPAKVIVLRAMLLSVACALISSAIIFVVLLASIVLFGTPPGDGGGQVGDAAFLAVVAGAVFLISVPISIIGGALVSLILACASRRRGIQPWMGLAVGALTGIVMGLTIAAIIVTVIDHFQIQDALGLALFCLGIATPIGSWYGWNMARWFDVSTTIDPSNDTGMKI